MKTRCVREIPWNFSKFLLNQEGKVLHLYYPELNFHHLELDILRYLRPR